MLSGGDGNPAPTTRERGTRWSTATSRPRCGPDSGIPILYGVDAVHGQSHVVGATIFPHEVGLGAAHDAELVERIGRATALEMAATGIRWDYGPVVAVPQDVRWGRTYEAFGEEPALVADLSAA